MKRLKLFFACLLMAVLSIGQVWGADEVVYTLTPASGSNNSYTGNCDVEIDGITWNLEGNSQQNPWRIGGGKNTGLSNVNRAVYSKTAMDNAITKVELTVGAASGITVNSLKLIVASNADFSSVIEEVTETFAANSKITFTPESPATEWAANAFYKFVFNVSVSGTNNKYLEFTKADFYAEESTGGDVIVKTLKSIEVEGMTTSYETGDAFSFDGTCTATYSVTKNDVPQADEEKTVTPTSVTSPDMSSAGVKTITVSFTDEETKTTTYDINVTAAQPKSSLILEDEYKDSGATAEDGAEWVVTSDAPESVYEAARGIHFGTGSSSQVQYVQLTTLDISGTITKVVVNASDATGTAEISVSVGGTDFTCSGSTTVANTNPGSNYTFTGSASGEIVVLIDRGDAAYKAIYVKSVVVSYEAAPDEPAVTVDPTSVSLATPDAVDDGVIDVTYTNIDETQITVTLSDDEDGNVPFSGSWLTANLHVDKDIAYTVTENSGAARSAYIRLTAKASNGTSPDVVKVIPVTQAKGIPTYTSLDAVFAAATGTNETVNITFDNWVISAVKGNNAYLTDGTYGLIIYTEGHGFEVGNVLSGTAQTLLKLYQGNAQLSGLMTTTTGLTVTTGGTVTARVLDAEGAAALTGANAGSLIKISGECTEPTTGRYYINGIQLYNTLYSFETPTVGDVYDCTGIFVMYNSYKEILPRQNGDLVPSTVTPTAVITFEDFNIEKGQNTTLAATVAPAVAASAEVTYSIVDGGEYVSREGDVLTANEIGIAHIRATVADNLPNYYGATKDITVTVTAPDSRYKAEQTGFTAITGNLTTVTEGAHKDKQYISYEGKQGASSNVPAIYDTDKIRLYQNGGLLVIGAAKGCKIDQVFLTTGGTYNTTTIGYSTSELSIATSGDNVAKNTTWNTAIGLNSDTVVIVCLGTDKYSRIDVAKLDVRYTGDPISVKSIAVSGTYQTDFTKNATFSHDGVVVTATYSDDSQADVTTLAEFSDPDMSTIGQKEVTVSYGGESTSYNIEVVAATLTEIAISGTYPTRFNVDDAFSHAGMTVTATYSDFSEEDVTNDATFSGYNKTVGGIQTVTVEYGDQSAQYSIIVVPANTDVITADDLEATGTTYTEFTGVTSLGTSAVYAGKTAKSSAGAIQVRTSKSEDGIVVTGQNGTKVVKSVAIDFATVPTSPKVLQVYGKHTAYTSAANLFNDEAKGDLIGTLGEDGSVDCTAANYEFIGIRSSDGAMYLASVMVTWGDAVIPPTVYTVTFNTDGGSTIDPVEVEEGQAVAKPADPTKDDYNFVEWQLNGVEYDFTAAVTANITLDAVWEHVTPPEPAYTEVRNDLTEGWYYTMCLDKAVTAVKAGSIWRVLSKAANGNDVILEEVTGTLDAGRPYIFRAAASTLEVAYTGDAVLTPVNDADNHGLIGSFTQEPIAQSPNNFIIYNNELYFVNSDNVKVGAHRAYLNMNGVPNYEPQQGNAPRRRVVMTVHGEQTATGCENINASETPVKMIIDGQLYILRGEKMYDATGKLVK